MRVTLYNMFFKMNAFVGYGFLLLFAIGIYLMYKGMWILFHAYIFIPWIVIPLLWYGG